MFKSVVNIKLNKLYFKLRNFFFLLNTSYCSITKMYSSMQTVEHVCIKIHFYLYQFIMYENWLVLSFILIYFLISSFEFDPRTRHTFWNLFGSSLIRGLLFSFNQSSVQRISSTPTVSAAKK